MALLTPQLQKFLLTKLTHCSSSLKPPKKYTSSSTTTKARTPCCSAIAIDAPSSLTGGVAGVRWGSTALQGLREEMEDDILVRSDGFDGFYFAAVFDGHGGLSSVKFLRDVLYKECVEALQGGLLLSGKDLKTIREALQEAFAKADAKLEMAGEEDESGSTATVMFLGNDTLFISHVEVLTNPHRPYGSNKASLQEIKRVRDAGGWIGNGRICGDIAVSRAFGDMRFKTKKNEMLKKGVVEGRWSEKFASRVQFNADLVSACPDIFQVTLGSDVEFVLLASDGLWDYMNSSEAISFVRNQLRQHGDVQLACEALAQAVLDRRSEDNVSIIIADLGQTDWQSLPLQQQNFAFELGQAFATIGIVSLGIWMSSQLSL
ncbi:protein phosphatase 2c 57 [Quercus suber]|uniref:protein-serine/threonine phosphatase n=1 Tax=Quercus suber TaxID=58331 RepID=A0AAW0LM25_QUESU